MGAARPLRPCSRRLRTHGRARLRQTAAARDRSRPGAEAESSAAGRNLPAGLSTQQGHEVFRQAGRLAWRDGDPVHRARYEPRLQIRRRCLRVCGRADGASGHTGQTCARARASGRSILAPEADIVPFRTGPFGGLWRGARPCTISSLRSRAARCSSFLGRNGVGKTTLIETICGLTTYQGGDIFFQGEPIQKLPPHRRNRLGYWLVAAGTRKYSPR